MESFERDFFISRIRCGYLRLKLDGVVYIFTPPSKDVAYESNEVYKEYYEQCLDDGVFSDDDTYKLLTDFNLWNDAETERLKKKIPEYLENVKIEMWRSFHKPTEVERMRLYLNRAKEELVTLFERRHQFDYMSCHGAALFARWQFIVQNCVKINGESPDWDNVNVSSLLSLINEESIEEGQIRELARSEPWSSIWSVNRKNNNLFGIPSCDFTEDQKRIVCWSMLFDSVNETEEPPSEELIADDDCFDGWLINKRREQKRESDRDLVEGRLGKNAGADEIYIPVQSQNNNDEDALRAETVLSMNGEYAKQIIRSRTNAVKGASGPLQEHDLPDVKLKVGMMANRR